MKSPWTREELDAAIRTNRERIEREEAERPGIRPLPPMTEDECREMLEAMAATAGERVLTEEECFLLGQLHAQYRMAIEARMLGKAPGRYYVISEADIARMTKPPG